MFRGEITIITLGKWLTFRMKGHVNIQSSCKMFVEIRKECKSYMHVHIMLGPRKCAK